MRCILSICKHWRSLLPLTVYSWMYYIYNGIWNSQKWLLLGSNHACLYACSYNIFCAMKYVYTIKMGIVIIERSIKDIYYSFLLFFLAEGEVVGHHHRTAPSCFTTVGLSIHCTYPAPQNKRVDILYLWRKYYTYILPYVRTIFIATHRKELPVNPVIFSSIHRRIWWK